MMENRMELSQTTVHTSEISLLKCTFKWLEKWQELIQQTMQHK